MLEKSFDRLALTMAVFTFLSVAASVTFTVTMFTEFSARLAGWTESFRLFVASTRNFNSVLLSGLSTARLARTETLLASFIGAKSTGGPWKLVSTSSNPSVTCMGIISIAPVASSSENKRAGLL